MKKTTKYFLVLVINIMAILILLEIGTYLLYPTISSQPFSRKRIENKLFEINNKNDAPIETPKNYTAAGFENKSLHPYLGYVYDTSLKDRNNYYGFGYKQTITKKAPNKLIIAISGGSVAMGLYRNSKDVIISELKKRPEFSETEIEIVNFSIGGFKQPQQLMTLNYFLSLGWEFDYWINLDGFNEITLPIAENYQFGINPFYPPFWKLYSKKVIEPGVLEKLSEIKNINNQRYKTKKILSSSMLSKSIFLLTLWEKYDQWQQNMAIQLDQELQNIMSQTNPPFQVTGPKTNFSSFKEVLQESANVWERTSFQMSTVCDAYEIKYLHFLQPNQYVKNSKIFTDEEKKIAFASGPYIYRTLAQLGYPILVKKGEKLTKKTVQFYDLTLMFEKEHRTVYADKCCHFNQLGYNAIAQKISSSMLLTSSGWK